MLSDGYLIVGCLLAILALFYWFDQQSDDLEIASRDVTVLRAGRLQRWSPDELDVYLSELNKVLPRDLIESDIEKIHNRARHAVDAVSRRDVASGDGRLDERGHPMHHGRREPGWTHAHDHRHTPAEILKATDRFARDADFWYHRRPQASADGDKKMDPVLAGAIKDLLAWRKSNGQTPHTLRDALVGPVSGKAALPLDNLDRVVVRRVVEVPVVMREKPPVILGAEHELMAYRLK